MCKKKKKKKKKNKKKKFLVACFRMGQKMETRPAGWQKYKYYRAILLRLGGVACAQNV